MAEREIKLEIPNKHDPACLGRRSETGRQYLCTCGLTDEQVDRAVSVAGSVGPPDVARAHALQAAEDALLDFDPEPVTRAIDALYDPALQAHERSYSGEYVIEWLQAEVRAGRADGAIVEQFCIDHTPYDELYEGS